MSSAKSLHHGECSTLQMGLGQHDSLIHVLHCFSVRSIQAWHNIAMLQPCALCLRKMLLLREDVTKQSPLDFIMFLSLLVSSVRMLSFRACPIMMLQVMTLDELEQRLSSLQAQYNESIRGVGMDLVFFKDAMTHLIKVRLLPCGTADNRA